jgi:hypothetical protein
VVEYSKTERSSSVGAHGNLEVIKPLSSREVLVNWNDATIGASTMQYLSRLILHKDSERYHNERMFDELDIKQAPIPIFVTSI